MSDKFVLEVGLVSEVKFIFKGEEEVTTFGPATKGDDDFEPAYSLGTGEVVPDTY